MADHGAASWILSTAAIPASRFPLPEKSSERKTPDTSGRTLPASCQKSNLPSASSKTSADIYDWDLNKSTMTFDQWVTALRQACLQRKKSVQRISVSASSCWRTVKAMEGAGGCVSAETLEQRMAAGLPLNLRDQASHLWLTPRAQESCEGQETFIKRNADRTDRCFGSLTAQTTTLWPTATASDANVTRARPPEKMIRKDGRNVLRTPSLAETVMQPKDFPYTKQDLAWAQADQPYRVARAKTDNWPTPRTKEGGSNAPTHGQGLTETVRQSWATPTARDWKDGAMINSTAKTRSNLSRQAPRMQKAGGSTSSTGLALNPLFVEALMGWPIGWTDCASAGTALSPWLRLMRFELLHLLHISTSEEETQLCLI
jgi:DNA (cytosine-5)-methyltransferase 1